MEFEDEDEVAIDITDYTLYFTVKQHPDDDEATYSQTVTSHSDPTNGVSAVNMTDEDTEDLLGNYYYEIRYKDDAGLVKTVCDGILTVGRSLQGAVS